MSAAAPWINDSSVTTPTVKKRTRKTRGSVATAPRTSRLATAARHIACFALLSLASYGLLALLGHSMLSSAQKSRANAELRTESARMDVLELGRQVNGLVDVESLGRWAGAHGFVRESGLVATNHVSKSEEF